MNMKNIHIYLEFKVCNNKFIKNRILFNIKTIFKNIIHRKCKKFYWNKIM